MLFRDTYVVVFGRNLIIVKYVLESYNRSNMHNLPRPKNHPRLVRTLETLNPKP